MYTYYHIKSLWRSLFKQNPQHFKGTPKTHIILFMFKQTKSCKLNQYTWKSRVTRSFFASSTRQGISIGLPIERYIKGISSINLYIKGIRKPTSTFQVYQACCNEVSLHTSERICINYHVHKQEITIKLDQIVLALPLRHKRIY